jgi:uncharacterized protein YbjT (DUF2867 family)
MNLLIFGATGSVGAQLVEQALQQGHRVSAFSRRAQQLPRMYPALRLLTRPDSNADSHSPPTPDSKLRLIAGDVLHPAAVEQAMPGHDAVLCALGAGRAGRVRSEGTRHIVQAMQAAGVRRLVCQTTLGVGDSWGNLNFFWKHVMFGGLLRSAFADHISQEAHVRQSDLDWIIVRPGAFTGGPKTGQYRHGFAGDDRGTQLKISRADVADFMLRQLSDDRYLRQSPGLAYGLSGFASLEADPTVDAGH